MRDNLTGISGGNVELLYGQSIYFVISIQEMDCFNETVCSFNENILLCLLQYRDSVAAEVRISRMCLCMDAWAGGFRHSPNRGCLVGRHGTDVFEVTTQVSVPTSTEIIVTSLFYTFARVRWKEDLASKSRMRRFWFIPFTFCLRFAM